MRRPPLGIEEKYEEVRHLINLGKERGYLLYDEINDVLPEDVQSPGTVDDPLLRDICLDDSDGRAVRLQGGLRTAPVPSGCEADED